MDRKKFYRILISAFLIMAFLPAALPQVTVEISKNKVIISGKTYYIHQVRKGETAYSISRAYGVTVEELTKENPPAVYGVKEGQTLRIPYKEPDQNETPLSKPAVIKDETKYIYHKLVQGETVYSLSKTYDVSESDIVAANKGIEITRLPVGSEIAIPRKEFMTGRQEFAVRESNFILHKVEKGESLSSIAEKYGITVRELRRENRNIRFPQVGDYVRIPGSAPVTVVNEAAKPDTVKPAEIKPEVVYQRPSGYTPVKNLSGHYNVALLLPLYLKENAVRSYIDSSKVVKGKSIPRTILRPEDWIYPGSLGFLEMYEGIMLAADTLRSLGMDINVHAFDIRGDTIELSRLINRGTFDNMDLIIGPVYSTNLVIMTKYAGKLGIPVVSPVPPFNNSALLNNSNLFMANASLEVAQNTISRKVAEYAADNFVFIHNDSAGIDPDVKNFREKIIRELSNRIPFEELKFKEFLFYSRSVFNNDSINRLSHALSPVAENVIILASEERPVLSETLQDIHTLSRKYQVRVFGYPIMRGLDNLDPKIIFDLDILMFSPYWIDYSKKDVKQFIADFRQKFFTEPDEISYAWLGYDITYYFLSGLAIHGKDFIAHPEIHNPDLLETEFDFQRKSSNDGFENQKLFPVRYSKDYEVRLEKESVLIQ